MAPTDLVSSPPIQFAMNSTTYNNNLSFPADMSGPNPSSAGVFSQIVSVLSSDPNSFGVYQLTPVGAGDATIRILVPVNISALPYRTSLILGYADSPSFPLAI